MASYIKENKYHLSMRIIHWLMAFMIIMLVAVGFYMNSLENTDPNKFEIYDLHKSFGLALLLLATLRVALRLATVIPKMHKSFPSYIVLAAKAGHFLLYIMMFLMPISGILMSQLSGYKVAFFGNELPFLVSENKPLGGFFKDIHETTALVLIAVITVHILATLKHRYIDKKDILFKMT